MHTAFIDLEKHRVEREALWNVLKISGVGGQLKEGIFFFLKEANTCVKVNGELSDNFAFGTE